MSNKIFPVKTSLVGARQATLRTLVTIIVILISFTTKDALAVSLEVDPLTQSVILGDQATVDVVVDPMGSFVGAFDIFVGWDDTILDLASVTVNPAGDLGLVTLDIVDTLGTTDLVNVVSISLAFDLTPFQDGTSIVNLFSLTFDTLALGTSALTLSPGAGGFLGNELGLPLPTEVSGGSITVASAQVPEPSTLMLMGIGLAGLGWMGRRKKNS